MLTVAAMLDVRICSAGRKASLEMWLNSLGGDVFKTATAINPVDYTVMLTE